MILNTKVAEYICSRGRRAKRPAAHFSCAILSDTGYPEKGGEQAMPEVLFWIYLINAVLLINHEIDSAYWKEWDLFRLPGGITVFLLLHFPMMFIVLYGLILVYRQAFLGLIFSLILSLSGMFAFSIHMYFIRKGRDEFKIPISLFILVATLIVSLIQAGITIYIMWT